MYIISGLSLELGDNKGRPEVISAAGNSITHNEMQQRLHLNSSSNLLSPGSGVVGVRSSKGHLKVI